MPTPDPQDLNSAIAIVKALRGTTEDNPIPSDKPLNKYVLSPLGKALDVLDTDLNLVTRAMRPLVTAANPKLESVYQAKGDNIVPSDLIDAQIPGKGVHKKVLGFAADVIFSPSTYLVGIGGLTKGAKVAKKTASLKEVGQEIKAGSKLAKQVAEIYGPGSEGIEKARAAGETVLLGSLSDQARAGQRALIHVGIPFTGVDYPLLRGQAIMARAGEAATAIKKSEFGKAFRNVFSTSTGNPKFDRLRQRIEHLVTNREDLVRQDSVKYAKDIAKLAKQLDVPFEEFRRDLFLLGEAEKYGEVNSEILRATHADTITNWKKVADGTLKDRINNLAGFHLLAANEKLRMHRTVMRELYQQQQGINVYTSGMRTTPEKFRTEFANIFTRQALVKILKDTTRKGKYKFSDMGELLRASSKGIDHPKLGRLTGDDAIVYSLTGPVEYQRIKSIDEKLRKISTKGPFALVPSAIDLGSGTEFKQMAAVGRELLSHIDTSFTLSHAIYRTNPEYLKKMMPEVHNIFSRLYKDKEWQIDALVNQFKIPKEIARKYPGGFDLAQEARRWNQNQYQRELDSGLRTGNLVADINYQAHIPVKGVRALLDKDKGYTGSARVWNDKHANQLQREFSNVDPTKLDFIYNQGLINDRQYKFIKKNGMKAVDRYTGLNKADANFMPYEVASKFIHTLTAEEVNILAREGKLKILGYKPVAKFFDDNPANVMRVRGLRGERARTAAEFFQALKDENIGVPISKAGLALEGYRTTKVEALKGLAFENEVADHIDKYYESVVLPPGVHPILGLYDNLQDVWKAWTLAIWPAYHLRNVLGNMWNNYLAGMDPIGKGAYYYEKAAEIQLRKKVNLVTAAGQKLTEADIVKLAQENGILNMGQFWGDIRHYFEDEMQGALGSLVHNKAITGGLTLGRHIENNARLAHFIWKLEEGFGAVEAARSVKKYLFNYADLSDTERYVFRRVLPFYCVDEDTECLTNKGWKKYYEIKDKDELLTYNLYSKELEWQKHKGIFSFDYVGQLISFNSRKIKLLCTPNHRCITTEYGIKQAIDIKEDDTCPMVGLNNFVDYDISDDTLKLLAWFITEGTRRRGGSDIVIYQKNYNKYILPLLGRKGIDYNTNIHPNSGVVMHRLIGDFRKRFNLLLAGNLWDIFSKLSRRQANVVREIVILAEGSVLPDYTFIAQEGEYRDILQLVWFLSGYNCKLGKRGFYERNAKVVKYGNKNIINYVGKVWCPSTSNSTAIFRRNGVITISGQTWTRNNIPLQLEALMTAPAKAGGVLKFKNAWESEVDGAPDERLLPDWMVRNFPVRSRYNETTKNFEYFLLGGWLPLADIDRLFEPDKFLANMLTPIIKEPFEQLANRDFFTGREIDLGDEYERVAGFNMPKRISHVLKKVRVVSEADRFTDEDADLSTKVTRFMTGKLYPLVEEKERVRREIEFSKRERNLKSQLKRAERKNDKSEIDRILSRLERLTVQQSEF